MVPPGGGGGGRAVIYVVYVLLARRVIDSRPLRREGEGRKGSLSQFDERAWALVVGATTTTPTAWMWTLRAPQGKRRAPSCFPKEVPLFSPAPPRPALRQRPPDTVLLYGSTVCSTVQYSTLDGRGDPTALFTSAWKRDLGPLTSWLR
jgi:hypothetical protein